MEAQYKELLRRRFLRSLPEGRQDKRLSLADAIEKYIKPGQKIHLAHTNSRPYGLMNELIRQHWKKKSEFEVAILTFCESCVAFFVGGMMRKAVTSLAGDLWPYPSPNPCVNRPWLSGEVEIEHWSMLTYAQRFLAGALRLPCMLTESLVGSTMAEHNMATGAFREIDDPFGSGKKIGLVSAYRPNISLIHVPACDCSGNAILTAPFGEGAIGAYAASDGVILSTEKIVSTDYIRRHNHMVKIPASIVKAVVELPLGSHPRGVTNVGMPELGQYAEDYHFMNQVKLAARKGKKELDDWIDQWILSCDTHDAYLEKLGYERAQRLRGKAQGSMWYEEILGASKGELGENGEPGNLPLDTDCFIGSEMMIVAAARMQVKLVQEMKLRNILAGIGAAHMASWLSLHRLRDIGIDVEVMAEIGYYGFEPRPGDPYIFNFKNTPTCLQTADIFSILGQYVPNGVNLGSLGAAQVDRIGNLNSTLIPGKLHLLGSGGGNDVASRSKAVVVTAYLSKDKFKHKVDYITSPGMNVRCVVTDRGIFEKDLGKNELKLTAYYSHGPTGYCSAEEVVADIRSRVEWDLEVSAELNVIGPPTREELYILRLYDPFKQFLR